MSHLGSRRLFLSVQAFSSANMLRGCFTRPGRIDWLADARTVRLSHAVSSINALPSQKTLLGVQTTFPATVCSVRRASSVKAFATQLAFFPKRAYSISAPPPSVYRYGLVTRQDADKKQLAAHKIQQARSWTRTFSSRPSCRKDKRKMPEHDHPRSSMQTADVEPKIDAERPIRPSSGEQLMSDIKNVSELWSGIPRPAMLWGLAGVVPYAITCLGTVYLSWNLAKNTQLSRHMADMTRPSIYSIDPSTAQHLFELLQPVQIGYGALLLSFLGAIHWGLEFAGYGGHLGNKRYLLGVLPAALAWPTLLLSTNAALVTQFFGFTALYWADSNACRRGWAPTWYQSYRFVLTTVVVTAILFTFVMQGWIREDLKSAPSHLKSLRQQQFKNMINQTREDMQGKGVEHSNSSSKPMEK